MACEFAWRNLSQDWGPQKAGASASCVTVDKTVSPKPAPNHLHLPLSPRQSPLQGEHLNHLLSLQKVHILTEARAESLLRFSAAGKRKKVLFIAFSPSSLLCD